MNNLSISDVVKTLEDLAVQSEGLTKPKDILLSEEEIDDILEDVIPSEMMAESSDDMDTQDYLEQVAIINT
jgi:hypothetical protein